MFEKKSAMKKFYGIEKGGSSNFCPFFRLTVNELLLGEAFVVSEKNRVSKLSMIKRKEAPTTIFRPTFFFSQHPNFF